MEKNEILKIVLDQINQLKDTLPDDKKFDVNENTVLFGTGSSIDSLSLVSVIVDLEATFSNEFNYDLSLTDDRAMTRAISPFENVHTLVDYIYELTSELKNK